MVAVSTLFAMVPRLLVVALLEVAEALVAVQVSVTTKPEAELLVQVPKLPIVFGPVVAVAIPQQRRTQTITLMTAVL